MRTPLACRGTSLAALLVLACDGTPEGVVVEPRLHSFGKSEWSAPVNLGPTIDTAAVENAPALSKDGLNLYFLSNREPGGQGGNDIWVARRECNDVNCPWAAPMNLGPTINRLQRGRAGAVHRWSPPLLRQRPAWWARGEQHLRLAPHTLTMTSPGDHQRFWVPA